MPRTLIALWLIACASPAIAAPLAPICSPGDIDLTGYTLTFSDEFNTLSVATVSPKSPATWYYWPPYGAAAAYSASVWDASAFSVSGGILSDKAFTDSGGAWHSGNLSSVDTTGAGFSQQWGYFEIRARMPNSASGSWPAFWLGQTGGIPAIKNGLPGEELDVFEWYGVAHDQVPGVVQQASHNWNVDGSQDLTLPYLYKPQTPMPDSTAPWSAFHNYGILVRPDSITWYIDGVQTNQIATPTSHMTSPFYMMVDYALGGGWPLSGAVNNSHLDVDWVRAYSLPVSKLPVGIDFSMDGIPIPATALAGVVPQSNWNNTSANPLSGNLATVKDSGGNTVPGMAVAWGANGSGGHWGFGGYNFTTNALGNGDLYSSALFAYGGSNSGWYAYVGATGVPFATYNVYVYFEGGAGSININGTPSGTMFTGGSTVSFPSASVTGFVAAANPPVAANYVVFPGITGTSFKVYETLGSGGGIVGVQIVPQ